MPTLPLPDLLLMTTSASIRVIDSLPGTGLKDHSHTVSTYVQTIR